MSYIKYEQRKITQFIFLVLNKTDLFCPQLNYKTHVEQATVLDIMPLLILNN